MSGYTADFEIEDLLRIQAGETIHAQETVTVGDWTADVDVELAPLIRELWAAGWSTYASCQDHPGTGKVWIGFSESNHAAAFLNAVAIHQKSKKDSLWQRANDWGFGFLEPTSVHNKGGDWEYHLTVTDDSHDNAASKFVAFGKPDFLLSVSVLFPRRDLSVVAERMRCYNKTSSDRVLALEADN